MWEKNYKNKAALITLIIIFFIASSAHAEYTAQTQSSADNYVKGELIVKFKDTVDINENQKHISSLNAASSADLDSLNRLNKEKAKSMKRLFREKKNSLSNIYIIRTDKDENLIELAEMYENNNYIEYAEPNYKIHILETPDDTYYFLEWSHQIADSEAGWDIETGSNKIIIAVIDTGIDLDHPDLDSKIWSNTGEIPGNSIDDDGNGYIDDIKGWDFINNDNDPDDDHSHGTHCGGIAAAETDNNRGVAGVCWGCTLMPVKSLNSFGGGTDITVGYSIIYAADNGADIISMSIGGPINSSFLEDAVNYAYDKGIVIIAAAGNENNNNFNYPAAYDNVIAVTASRSTDERASFSTYGYWTDIAAPGLNIFSTVINSYNFKSGTSMACPFVAGVAGLLLSDNSDLTNDMIETILKSSTDPVTSTVYMGTGRINVKEALEKADSAIIAKLNDSLDGITADGTLSITGTAEGLNFINYSLYYAKGIYPDSWTMISSSTAPITDSELGQFNTVTVENNIYTIKLQVTDVNGNIFIDYILINVDNQPNRTLYYIFYKIPDNTGLNLITLPLGHNFITAEDLCQSITHSDAITRWDPTTQQYIGHPCGTPFNNFTLTDGEGYFISVTQNTIWALTGTIMTLPPIDLIKLQDNTGLNLIGLPYNSIITPFTAEGLCQNITHSDTITQWNPTTQQYIGHPCTTSFNNFTLNNREGYFVSVT